MVASHPLQQLLTLIDALSRRERVILLSVLVGAMGFVWWEVLMPPQKKAVLELEEKVLAASKRRGELINLAEEVKARAHTDPNQKTLDYRRNLTAEVKELEKSLRNATRSLVPPEQMPKALQDLMRGAEGVRLVGMEVLPAQPLAAANVTGEAGGFLGGGDGQVSEQVLFRHGLKIRLQGQYFGILTYLQALERSSWTLFWEGIDYQVREHPLADVTLQIFTLSLAREWLGI